MGEAFWVFIGILAGALIQFFLQKLEKRSGAKAAFQVLKTEIDLNLKDVDKFKDNIQNLKHLISSAQIKPEEINIFMSGFDYSAMGPLTSQGYFHYLLGPKRASAYIEFMRFFNNANAQGLSGWVRDQHTQGHSISVLNGLVERADNLAGELRKIKSARMSPFSMSLREG